MIAFKTAKLLRLLFVLALLILCALLAWASILQIMGMDIQWWAKAMIIICLAASVIVIILLRKLWLKRKEMKFVDGIIGNDMPGNISAIDEASNELRKRFRQAVNTLKKSHLKGRGNPLYVLPWYLLVGKSGSGKSTAIKSARLPSPFGDINRISGIEGTRNCDWWFLDDSVVIDIAGRYALHRNENLDKNEWMSFLNHLVKYRKKEPINGIIVAVEADQLLKGDPEKIEEEGRIIRNRVDEVIHVMGAKFPIYLLVTKCDLIYGMNRFCRLLSESTLEQAMGVMNHDSETEISIIVDKTMDNLVAKLKDFRLILSGREEVRDQHWVDPEVLLFPEELSRLRKGLKLFCKGAFKDNPFQELPPVRGIYFCSGRQSGRPVESHADAGKNLGGQELPGTGHGFFLHDFFAKILPADRSLYCPTRQAKEWQKLTGNLWLTGFVTIALALCILVTHSWNENKAAVNVVSPQYRSAILFKNDPAVDTAIMAEFGRQIKEIEQINVNWKMPRMGLNASIRLEKELKQRYCRLFYEHFDADSNNKIQGQIANGGWSKDDFEPAVRYIPFITRRINIVKARLSGADRRQLAELPDPDYALMMFGSERKQTADDLKPYKMVYIDYLIWQKEMDPLNKSLAGMQRLLSNYFAENAGDIRWLVTWADRHLRGRAITMNLFWHGNMPDSGLAFIGPAFTREGQKLIGHFVMDELEAAVEQSSSFPSSKEQFALWYQDAYFGAWMNFCLEFGKGITLFRISSEQDKALELFTGDASPYSALFNAMSNELLSPLEKDSWPSLQPAGENEKKYAVWLNQIHVFGIIRHAASADGVLDNPAAKALGEKITRKAGVAAKMAMGAMEENRIVKAKEAYQHYAKALSGFAGVTADKKYAHQVARDGFEDNPAEAKSHLYAAVKAMANLKIAMNPGAATSKEIGKDPFWCLLSDPLDRLWQFTVAQAGCYLQDLWDQEVIVKVQRQQDPRQTSLMMFGDPKLAPHFMRAHAAPFIQQSSSHGYYTIERQNARVPFHRTFFDYMQRGERWEAASGGGVRQNYIVSITAYPTDVNSEARIKPYMTRLTLEGPEGPITLENKQFPSEKKFTWAPAVDGNVLLQIMFENMVLTVRYAGHLAFGQFLSDFSSGQRIFTAEQFPEHRAELARLGVRYIEVIYRMPEGQMKPITRLVGATPGQPPRKIVQCAQPGS
jgi:type VI secretion system protein ImpL